MTCLRAELALRCCPCRCENSIATLHGAVRGSFNQAGVFSAREQWTTKSKRRKSHDVWREQFQAGSVRRQLLSGRVITLVPERWIGPSGAARHSEPGAADVERGVNAALAFTAAAAAVSCSVRVYSAGIGRCLSVDWCCVAAGFFRRVRAALPLIPPDCRRGTQWAACVSLGGK
jgi:hypothetical protein